MVNRHALHYPTLYLTKENNFRLQKILNGADDDALPDFTYDLYDNLDRVTKITTDLGTPTETQTFDYDAQGNLDDKYVGATLVYDYTFDVENRLASVRTNNQTTTFAYDADGQRILTSRPNDTLVYTPFPDYEREVTDGGAVTERTTYSIAGQMVGVRVKVSGGSNTLYYTYTDHLGSVVAMSDTAGGVICVKSLREIPASPRCSVVARIQMSQNRPKAIANSEMPSARRFFRRRTVCRSIMSWFPRAPTT